MRKLSSLLKATAATLIVLALTLGALPFSAAFAEETAPEKRVVENTVTDGWGINTIGADIAQELKGNFDDIYIVNIDAAEVDMPWIIKLGYSEWGIAHKGNNVTYRPAEGRSRVKITAGIISEDVDRAGNYSGFSPDYPNGGDAPFWFNSNNEGVPSDITFEDIDFEFSLFGTALVSGFTGGSRLTFKNCTITDRGGRLDGTGNRTAFSGSQGYLTLIDTEIIRGTESAAGNIFTGSYTVTNGGSNQNYKRVILAGSTSFSGTIGSNTAVYDFRDLEVSLTESEGMAALSAAGDVKLGSTVQDTVLYYTTDGSTPTADNGTLYTQQFEVTQTNAVISVAAYIPATGEGNSARMEMYSPVIQFIANKAVTGDDVTIDYAERTVSFDGDTIEANSAADFDGDEIESGAAVSPSQKIYLRYKGESAVFEFTVPQPDAPDVTVSVVDVKVNSLAVTDIEGLEYRLGEAGEWQQDAEFAGLTVGTEYQIYYRYAATESAFESKAASITASTLGKHPMPGADDITINYLTGTITFSGIQVSKTEGSFTTANQLFSGAEVIPGMKLYLRRPENLEFAASDVFVLTLADAPAAPAESGVAVTKTGNSIKLVLEGAEFKLGNQAYSSSGEFADLTANTEYTIRVRIAATESSFAGAELVLTVKTEGASSGGCTSDVGGTLALLASVLAVCFVFVSRKRHTVR